MRRLVVLALAGLALTACGTVSATSALRSWVSQSNFSRNVLTVAGDASHAAAELRRAGSTSGQLHLVCAVLLVDTEASNASLPSPDATTNDLLSRAYTALGAGANLCYRAAALPATRAAALRDLRQGVALLSEARARIANAAG